MREAASILGIGAHPDDLEILAGGTLALYARRGWRVTMACLTNGEMGHMVIPPWELAAIREREARAAAAVLGAEFHWVGLPDEFLGTDMETRLRVVDLIRAVRPDVIVTHAPQCYHPDHRATFELVFAASFLATIPHIERACQSIASVPPILCMDTVSGLDFQPEFYVDITDVFELKIEALKKHESQIRWLKEHDHIDVLEHVRVTNRFRGLQCNATYAEGFTLARRWPGVPAGWVLP